MEGGVKPKLTPEQYANGGGTRCPVCLGRHIDVGDSEFDGPHATVNCLCLGCRHEWVDVYSLTGYDNLQAPELVEAV